MELTRRAFLERGVGAITVLGFSLVTIPGGKKLCLAAEGDRVAEIPVIWLALGGCTGCSVSLLNTTSPTIQEVLLEEVLPGKHISLGFHSTVMAGQGHEAIEAMEKVARDEKGKYVLVVDGVVSAKDQGLYCQVGEKNGRPVTGYERVRDLGASAGAVIAAGACAAFGGIPAAPPNPTEGLPVTEVFTRERIDTPVVNIPGCPPHPDWIVGTLAAFILGGLEALKLDERGRPAAFFGECIHDNCPYRGHFEQGRFAERFGEHGCLIKLGCKGPITYADCPIRKFNGGESWCCEAGHPCIGCCHPDFPFQKSMFEPVEPSQLSLPEVYPAAQGAGLGQRADKSPYVAIGLIGAGGFVAGAGVALAAKKLKSLSAEKQSASRAAELPAGKEPSHE